MQEHKLHRWFNIVAKWYVHRVHANFGSTIRPTEVRGCIVRLMTSSSVINHKRMKYQFIQKLRKLFQWVLERFFLHQEKVKKEKKTLKSLKWFGARGYFFPSDFISINPQIQTVKDPAVFVLDCLNNLPLGHHADLITFGTFPTCR